MKRILLAVASLLLAACGGGYEGPESGKVIEHKYDDPDSWYQPGYTIDGGQNCSGGYNGQPRICTDNPDTHIPGMWHHEPAHWHLRLDDGTKEGDFEVDEDTYDEVRDGQWFDTKTGQVVPK